MACSTRQGRSAVGVLVTLAVLGLAIVAFPVEQVAKALLVLVLAGVGLGLVLGQQRLTGTLARWAGALALVATVWPIVTARVREFVLDGIEGSEPSVSAGQVLHELGYHLTTIAMVVLLLLLAALVLLASARVQASLPPPRPGPRPQVRRRGQVIDIEEVPAATDQGLGLRGDEPTDDLGLFR